MPGKSGLERQRPLVERGVAVPIVFLTGHADVPASVHAMKSGAIDFLEKPVDEDKLLSAIENALEVDVAARRERGDLSDLRTRLASLTEREREVLVEVVAGKLNKQVASSLGIA